MDGVATQLVAKLALTVHVLTGYPVLEPPSEVQLLPRAEPNQNVCATFCNAQRAFPPERGLQLADDLVSIGNLRDRAVLLHKLVHVAQARQGVFAELPCCERYYYSEAEAHGAGHSYLRRLRLSGATLADPKRWVGAAWPCRPDNLRLAKATPAPSPAAEVLRSAIRLPCQAKTIPDLRAQAERLGPARLESNWVHYSSNWAPDSPLGITGRRLVFSVGDDELTVQFSGLIGRPDHVAASYLAGTAKRPLLFALADPSCAIHTARLVTYDVAGRPTWLQDLDDALRPLGEPEPLNPPVPAGEDPPGIPVGLVDSGVNYLLPEIASRLARSPSGEILGYDYWDLDRRPFDASLTPDPFFPGRHGTRIASLVLKEAPVAKLVPYRYPRHDMARMAALIQDAADQSIRVMNVSLVSRDRDEWLPFRDAAAAHPEMLFVVAAGNYDSNIEQLPHYPAAFALANMVVVTSASADGRLTAGVSWGPQSVDLMATGESVEALNFDGELRAVSGSSYATARVSALAACLLADHPDWTTAELKAAIFAEAEASVTGKVAQGFIPGTALGARGACDPQYLAAQ